MGRKDLISGIFWFLCSILIIIGSLRLPLGTVGNPGPGFLPLLIGALLSTVSLVFFIVSFSQCSPEPRALGVEKKQQYKIVATLLILFVYAIAFPSLGFSWPTLLLMLFLFKVIGELGWKASIGGAILTWVCSYLLFKILLKVQLPTGPLGI